MATLTITVPTATAQRVAAAVGYFTNERGEAITPATMDEVKAFVIQNLKDAVLSYEKEMAARAAKSAVADVDDIV